MEPFEIMVSESQERMLCVVEPERLDAVLAVCAQAGRSTATAIGEVTDTRRLRVFDGEDARRRHAGRRARRRVPGSTTSSRAEPATPLYPAPPRALSRRATARETLLALLGTAEPRVAPAGCSSSTTAIVGSRTVRRPEQADAAVLALADDGGGAIAVVDRRQRPPRRPDPYRGAVEAVLECARQPRLRRRRAARADELPELRQPREAAHRLAAHAGGRAGSATPAARSASRSSAATSRSTTRAPRARSSRRRSSAWSASCPTPRAPGGSASPREGDAIALVGGDARRRWPARSWPSCAAARPRGRCPPSTSASCARRTPRSARACGRARSRAPTTSPRVASPSRSPSAASPAASARASSRLRRRREQRCSARPRAAFVVSGAREALARGRPARAHRRRRRRSRWPSPASSTFPVAELSGVHGEGLAGLLA